MAGLIIEYFPEIARFLPASAFVAIQVHTERLRDLGGFLVIIGVAGELWIGFRASRVETDLREETSKSISESTERAAKAEQAAAEANRLAEQERLERIKLERELSPRWFENQHEAIERLSPFRGTEAVFIYVPDLECLRTAEQIAFVLNGAGWKVTPQPVLELNPLYEDAITIEASLPRGAPLAGAALIDELNKAGLSATRPPGVPPNNPDNPGLVIVHVGMKPSPLDTRINAHAAAMEKAIREDAAQMEIPDVAKFQQVMEVPDLNKFHQAILAEVKDLKPGTHGGRLALPRWPVTPPQA